MTTRPATETKQAAFLAALLENTNITAACRAARISRGTFYTWMSDPAFKARMSELRERLITEALDGLALRTRAALEALDAALVDEAAAVRLRAGGLVLDHLLKLKDVVDVEARLKALEERAAQNERMRP